MAQEGAAMSRRHGAALMASGCLLLAGCAAPPAAVSPADTVAQLRTGLPLLTCRDSCVGEWQRAQPQAAQLAAADRWADLAALTVRVGYQDDLSLYYLGQAAEHLGYPGAAASYYRQSTYVSGTTIACQNLSRICGGMAFPRAALRRLAAIDRRLARPQPRRGVPAPPGSEAPAAAPEELATPAAPEPEPPAEAAAAPALPVQAVSPAPAPTPTPGRPPPSEYIEPPPPPR